MVRGHATKAVPSPQKKKSVSKSTKADLVFPVGRVTRALRHVIAPDVRAGKKSRAGRVSAKSGVFMAGVLESVTIDLLAQARGRLFKTTKNSDGKTEITAKRTRITPRDLCLAAKEDPQWKDLTKDIIFMGNAGDVFEELDIKLLSKRQQKKKMAEVTRRHDAKVEQMNGESDNLSD